jgi:hypothetical protein
MPIAALLPIALQLLPSLARWIGGDSAGQVAQAVAGAVQAVAGGDTPEAAAAAIADPAKRGELLLKLAEIHATQEAAARAAELEELRALLGDAASARGQTVDLAKVGSPMAWGAPVVSVVILLSFGVMLWLVVARPASAAAINSELANVLLGTLAALATQVANYWLGSSMGSLRHAEELRHTRAALATSVPASLVDAGRPLGLGARA